MDSTKSTSEESKSSSRPESHEKTADKEKAATETNSVGGQELMDELGRLGTRFVAVAQAAWESDERKQFETDLRNGLDSVVESLEEGFQRIRESEQTKESLDKAKDVAETITEKVSTSQTAHELADGLMQGLRVLGERLDTLVDEFQAKKQAQRASGEPEQDIPVEDISVENKDG